MCGFVGYFLPDGVRAPQPDLATALHALRHRGPDGERQYINPARTFGCGFRRLSIIDLDTGDQPLISSAAGHAFVGNGEIYNYLEIRQQLPDYRFRTSGDMEAALALYERDGLRFVEELNGMFAIALFDETAKVLHLVRDRMGVKPLYWCRRQDGAIVFSSEIKGLLGLGGIAPKADDAAARLFITHGYVPAPMTLYEGIHKVPPGCILSVDAEGEISTRPYWKPHSGAAPEDPGRIKANLTDLLRDSVRLQLRSDVPVGALLSGGVDSGLMVALAAEMSELPINTFSVRFEGSNVDETPLAALVAKRYGTRHQTLDVSAASISEHLLNLVWYCDDPINDAALLPNFLVERALSEHVKVALNGSGGDELFAGYGRYFPLPVETRYLTLPRGLRKNLVEPLAALVNPELAWKLARAEKFQRDGGGYLHDHSTQFPAPLLRQMGWPEPLPVPAHRKYFDGFDGPAQSAALNADIGTYLIDNLMTLLDRTSMAVGVEGRVPYLDHRLVEAALAVPPEVRTPNGQPKGLQKAIAADYLPAEILSAPKRGFASPVPVWFERGLAGGAAKLLKHPISLGRGWWTNAALDRLLSNPRRYAFQLYTLMVLELTVRLHIEQPFQAEPPNISLEDYVNDL